MSYPYLERSFKIRKTQWKDLKGAAIFESTIAYPVDTGRKLNIRKTLRRHPGRHLNVLCTFNLRPVSTG